ncbi:MAG: hypothetical protein AABZ53_14950 [Planctomycetota bacterium]
MSSTNQPLANEPAPASGLARRLRYTLLTALLVLGVLVSVTLVNVLGERFARRFDVTATGEHRLSPRSSKLTASLTGAYEVIIAADTAALDRRARQDAIDVMDRFGKSSTSAGGSFTHRIIDVASAQGRADYATLLGELAKGDAALMAEERKRVEAAARNTVALSVDLNQNFGPALGNFLGTISGTDPQATTILGRLQASLAGLPASLRTTGTAVSGIPALLDRTVQGVAVPSLVASVAQLTPPLQELARTLLSIEADLRQLADAHPPAAQTARQVADGVKSRREQFDIVTDSLSRVTYPDTLLVAEALARSATVLVRGPRHASSRPSVIALPFEQIFPTREELEASGLASADLRRRAEDLIASALSVLVNPNPPIVVMLTAEPAIAARQVRAFEVASLRLRRSGADVISWDLLISPDQPSLAKLDPTGTRPVVYAVRMPDTTQGKDSVSQKTGLERRRLVADAVLALSQRGSPLLLSIGPSIVPVDKEPDPIDAVLAPFGLSARSDRVVMGEQTPANAPRQVLTDMYVSVPASEHPVAGAIRGLPTLLPWPTSLRIKDASAATTTTLLEFPGVPNVWAESQWQVSKAAQGDPRIRQPEPPKFDEATDAHDGPWRMAMAGERARTNAPAQRLIAVASNEWLSDTLVRMTQNVEGREIATCPGNLQFFESSVYWLAGQESLIGASASSRQIAIVGPIAESRLTALRFVLIAGLPLCVLVLGLFYRAARG